MKRTLLVLALAGIGVSFERPATFERPSAVVIVTLDTTRADRLSPYGFGGASMPSFDRLAREGVLFERAASVAPLTLPAHTSLFTGLFPPSHHVRDNADSPLSPVQVTLAESLRSRGFQTAAFVGSTILDADRGLAQGFDTYVDVSTALGLASQRRERPADAVIGDAVSWLESVQRTPFFLWVHLNDPHCPHDPPEPYRSRYLDPYTGELAFVDAQIGVLLDALSRRDLLKHAIVIIVGDHGESLGEHGERDHGLTLYQSVLRIPLIVRSPGLVPRRVDAPVRLIDVMPTVLDLLGVEPPPMEGVSLVELMTGALPTIDVEAYAETVYAERSEPITRDLRERLGALGYVTDSHATASRRTHEEDVENSSGSAGVCRRLTACGR
jgi:choline-sulfatase